VNKWRGQLPWPTVIHPLTTRSWLAFRRLRARFDHFHHFRNRFAFFPGFVGGWYWGYPYYDYAAYGNGCWRWDGWQWINVCYDYGGYNYGY
jgi:hypothetical protein